MRSERIFVARLNIEHYRDLLTQQIDEAQRSTIMRLLSEEEAQLQALLDDPPEDSEER